MKPFPVKSRTPHVGRSLVEMLGILCIIGLLSIGGLVGYKQLQLHWAMQEFYRGAAHIAFSVLSIFKPSDFTSNNQDVSVIVQRYGYFPKDIQFVEQRFGVILDNDNPHVGGRIIRIRVSGIPESACQQVLRWRTKEVIYVEHVETGLSTLSSTDKDISDACYYMNTFDIAYPLDKDALSGASGGVTPPAPPPDPTPTPPLTLSDLLLCRKDTGECDVWDPCKETDTFRAFFRPKNSSVVLSIDDERELCAAYSNEAQRIYRLFGADYPILLAKLDDNCSSSDPSFYVKGTFANFTTFKATADYLATCGVCPSETPYFYDGSCHVCQKNYVEHNTVCCPPASPYFYSGSCQICPEGWTLTSDDVCCPAERPYRYNSQCNFCPDGDIEIVAEKLCCAQATPHYYGGSCHRCPEGYNETHQNVGIECCPPTEQHFYDNQCNVCPVGSPVLVAGNCCPVSEPLWVDGACSACEKGQELDGNTCVCANKSSCQTLLSNAKSNLASLESSRDTLELAAKACGSFPYSPCGNSACQCRVEDGFTLCTCQKEVTYSTFKAKITARSYVKRECVSGTLQLHKVKQEQIENLSSECSCDARTWADTLSETTDQTLSGGSCS